jgi:hypothetical protein
MDNIVAISKKIDDSHIVWIYPFEFGNSCKARNIPKNAMAL